MTGVQTCALPIYCGGHGNNSGGGHGHSGGSNGSTAFEVKEGCYVKAFVFALNGKINVHGTSTNCGHSTNSPTVMKGMFIARTIQGNNNITWNWNTNCPNCVFPNRTGDQDVLSTTNNVLNVSNLSVVSFPEPFETTTNINFSSAIDGHVNVEVYDISGKHITTLYDADVTAGQEYNAIFDATALSSGMYFFKVISGTDVISGKMMHLTK